MLFWESEPTIGKSKKTGLTIRVEAHSVILRVCAFIFLLKSWQNRQHTSYTSEGILTLLIHITPCLNTKRTAKRSEYNGVYK